MIAKKTAKRNSKEDAVFQVIFSILALIFIIFLVASNLKIDKKRKEMLDKISSLKADIQSLQDQKEKLQKGITQTGQESYWEEKARQEGFVKEGENPVVVVPPQQESGQNGTSGQPLSRKIWEQIKDAIATIFWK